MTPTGSRPAGIPMNRFLTLPPWISVAATALAVALIIRIVSVMQSGAVEPLVALRTYLFWALVCVPVALLGDLLLRTIWNYQISQMARQRIRARRHR